MWLALLPMILTVISPILTEMVKGLAHKINATVPPNVVPVIGATIGGICGELTKVFDPSLNIDPVIGAVSGLAGTGLHQALFAHKFKSPKA